MTLSIDLYWSFRSPYSYLATPRLRAMAQTFDLEINLRPVYPLAIRTPDFFGDLDPLWVPYLIRDTFRIAEKEHLPYGRPNPDPVVMDMVTRKISPEQPYIRRLTRLGVLAEEQGIGMDFIYEVATLIWSGEVNWTEGTHLADAVARAGGDLAVMDAAVAAHAEELDAIIEKNQVAQREGGHWGVPLMVFEGEPFFGQDRIDDLVWRMQQKGLEAR